MFYYEDPIDGGEIEVTNIATASYALKLANDDYFGVFYQGQEMLKELNRLGGEIFNQKYALVKPYLPKDTDTATDTATHQIQQDTPKVIPNPLPATVPASVRAALKYLDAQYSKAEEYFQAEFANDSSEINSSRIAVEAKVAQWFKGEIGKAWLGGHRSIVLSGCTLTYEGGVVNFSYKDIDDDEDD